MEEELEKVKRELGELKGEILEMREEIKKLIQVCSRMDGHISFVNETYNVVRRPLSAIVSMVSKTITNDTDSSLPQIKE